MNAAEKVREILFSPVVPDNFGHPSKGNMIDDEKRYTHGIHTFSKVLNITIV